MKTTTTHPPTTEDLGIVLGVFWCNFLDLFRKPFDIPRAYAFRRIAIAHQMRLAFSLAELDFSHYARFVELFQRAVDEVIASLVQNEELTPDELFHRLARRFTLVLLNEGEEFHDRAGKLIGPATCMQRFEDEIVPVMKATRDDLQGLHDRVRSQR